MSAARAHTNPAVLRWARESSGLTPEEAAHRLKIAEGLLRRAEVGQHRLTLKQAHRAAALYGRPLAVLFADEPPREASIETKYRRLRGAPAPPWSPEMVKLEREIRERQEATVELYEALGDSPPWLEAATTLGLPARLPSVDEVRAVLNISASALRGPKPADPWHSRRILVHVVEWCGVLVVRQSIPDLGVRGFLLPHDLVPAIFVNSGEFARAQAFTIVHEFAHLLLAASGQRKADEEAWCEEFAGSVLMPRGELVEHFGAVRVPDSVATSQALADWFGVSTYAAAVRAWRLDLLTTEEMVQVRDRWVQSGLRVGGGNGNRTKVARLSPTFTDLVLAAADSSAVTLSMASHLLKTKVEDFDKLRKYTAEALVG